MKHMKTMSRMSAVATATSPLSIKLAGITNIIDRLLLAVRQAPWKTAF